MTRCTCYTSTECLTSFTNLETLEETEWYYCARCKSRQPSTKRLSLHTLPNVSDFSNKNWELCMCVYEQSVINISLKKAEIVYSHPLHRLH